MIRPALFSTSRQQRAVGRNLALDTVASIGVGVTAALVTTLLPTIARRGGLEPIGLAALAAAPFIANLLGAFAGRVGPRSRNQLALITGWRRGLAPAARRVRERSGDDRGLGRLLAQPVAQRPVSTCACGGRCTRHGSSVGSSASSARGGRPPRPSRRWPAGSSPTGSAARLRSRWRAWSGSSARSRTSGLRSPDTERPPSFSPRDSFRALRTSPILSRVALAQGFYGGGLIAAAPLYAIVNVDRLNLSLSDVGIIGILTAAATTFSFLLWGAVADRFGPLIAMRLGSALGLAALVAYALAPDVAVLWVAAVAAGAGSASIDVGIASVVSDHTSLSARAAAMAGWNAITGARGIVAAFTMSILLQVGIVDVTSGLLLCACVSAIGVVLYARASVDPVADDATVEPSRVTRVVHGLRSAASASRATRSRLHGLIPSLRWARCA